MSVFPFPTIPIIRNGIAAGYPQVKGHCPACGWKTLFVGSGGYLTCSLMSCPDPCAASELLQRHEPVVSPRPNQHHQETP